MLNTSHSAQKKRRQLSGARKELTNWLDWLDWSQKINQSNHMDHSLGLTQWNYEPCCVGPPKRMGHGGEFWQNCGPLEKVMANLQYSWTYFSIPNFSIPALRTPWTVWKGKKNRTLKDELPRSVGAQYATGDQWRNNSRKNEGMEPKKQQHPVVDMTGDGSRVWCCKQQYSIETWNVRSMNQGKLEVVKQEMARVNVDILGSSELKWTGMGEFNSDDRYIY